MARPDSWEGALSRHPCPPAVVVGVDSITGLQSARILHGYGIPVIGVAKDGRHWGARTNACLDVVVAPLSGPPLVEALLAVGSRLRRTGVLLPCTDDSVLTVSEHRAALGQYFAVKLADHDVVTLLMDKARFTSWAEEQGFSVPRTQVLASATDAQRASDLRYPCVLKPSVKTRAWLERTRVKCIAVQDHAELVATYDELAATAPSLVAQEWVAGPESSLVSCNAYFGRGGTPLATFVSRKLRQWPPDIGTSASGEEVRDDETLMTTVRLFRDVSYQGLAYLETKRDARTDRMFIIEPNVGRPTGRSAIAEAGGVRLLLTAYCDALGLPLPVEREQRFTGAKWLDLRRDLQAILVRRKEPAVSITAWLRWMRGPKAHAIWSARDTAPFITDVRMCLGTGLHAAVRTARDRESPRRGQSPTASGQSSLRAPI